MTKSNPGQNFDQYVERGKQLLGGVSVRTKILGIVLGLTTLLGLGVTWEVRVVMGRVLLDELDTRGTAVISDLAARSVDPILLNDSFSVHQLLTQTVANHPDVLYAFVLDPQGRVKAHSFGADGFPAQLLDLERNDEGASVYDSSLGRIHDFAEPILEGRAGMARVGMSETRLQALIDAITGQMLLTTLVVSLFGIAAAIFLTWILTRPILDLVSTTKRVGSGDLSARARHWAADEIGVLADAFNAMVAELEDSQATITEKEASRTRLLGQLISAQEEERKRIARELHDGVGQALNSLTLGIFALAQMDDEAEIDAKVVELRNATEETLRTVRQLSRGLRPSVLDDLGLSEALGHYVAEFTTLYPGFDVDSHLEISRRLQPAAETALYRMVQEAMTNAARHSSGRTISLVLSQRDGWTQAIIEDDGTGFDVEAVRREGESVGIHGIAERADLVGGHVQFESTGLGTTVFIEVPT